jgi:glycerophosphoryl diester phosphodiesterase
MAGFPPVTLVIAHRGAWDPAPQNSLEAFERAIALGADMIELDVRRTRDGVLIVEHDPIDGQPSGPTLAEVLELTSNRIGVDVEVKEPGYVDQVVAMLDPAHHLLTSFHDAVVAEAKERVPALRTGLLVAGSAETAFARADAAAADYLVLQQSLPDAPLPILVWTVNDAVAIERYLADPAIAGIITDRLEIALSARTASAGHR